MEICRFVLVGLLLTSTSRDFVKGVVEIFPSGIAPVCQAGDQLELTCSLTEMFLQWEFTVFLENSTYTRLITSSSMNISGQLTISTSVITFSRLSGQGTLPLVSRVVVSPVSSGLNGTVVKCSEVGLSSTESVATTTIYIIGGDIIIPNPELSIQSHSEQFSSKNITVVIEWSISNLQIYHQQLLQDISIYVVPNPLAITYTGNKTFQLILLYNTQYIVNITQPGICRQPNQTAFIELSYNKCSNPSKLIHSDVVAVGYVVDPALEGESITFICLTGTILNGPNSATCMGNGEWEPDPREVNCISELYMTTGTTTSKRPDSSPATTAMLRIALISVTCVLVMISALIFVIGFVCGHYFCQRWRKSANENDESPSDPATEPREDLELRENVYITMHPN